jgi:hypothetical protein
VAEALGIFLVEFLPPECKNKTIFSLLKELCSIALSMLKKTGTRSQSLQPIIAFLTEFVKAHGESAESGTIEAMKGQNVCGSRSEVAVVLTDLLLLTVDEFRSASEAASPMQDKEQDQGQPPFESKSQPGEKGNGHPGCEFYGMLSLFTTCLEVCPTYFFSLPSAAGLEGRDDLLYWKACEAAAGALNEPDVATAKLGMDFFDTLVCFSIIHGLNFYVYTRILIF